MNLCRNVVKKYYSVVIGEEKRVREKRGISSINRPELDVAKAWFDVIG